MFLGVNEVIHSLPFIIITGNLFYSTKQFGKIPNFIKKMEKVDFLGTNLYFNKMYTNYRCS